MRLLIYFLDRLVGEAAVETMGAFGGPGKSGRIDGQGRGYEGEVSYPLEHEKGVLYYHCNHT